jgi:hypothetical protein
MGLLAVLGPFRRWFQIALMRPGRAIRRASDDAGREAPRRCGHRGDTVIVERLTPLPGSPFPPLFGIMKQDAVFGSLTLYEEAP